MIVATSCLLALLLLPASAAGQAAEPGATPGQEQPAPQAEHVVAQVAAPSPQASSQAQPQPAAAQQQPAPAGQQPPAPQPAPPVTPAPGLVPATAVDAHGGTIPDIKAHRGSPATFVRRRADRVELNLGPVDPNAAVVLEVDGRKVSRAEFRRRALMFAAVNETDKYVTKILTDMEMERATAAGEKRDFSVSEADVQARLDDMKNLIRANARGQMVPDAEMKPSDDPNDPGERAVKEYLDSIEDSIGMAEYRKLLAGDAQFEKAYLPFPKEKVEGEAWDPQNGPPPLDEPRPDWMPAATWDALGKTDGGRNMRSFMKQWAIKGEEIPAMFKPSIMSMIRDALIGEAGVTYYFDETMPDDVLMRVGDHVVTTDEVWPMVAGRLSDTDIDLIVRELLTLEAVKKGLVAAGAWMDDAQYKEAWDEHAGQYANSFIPLRTIIQLRGYTSVDRFREHFRYRESFNRWKKKTLTDEDILAYFQGGGRLFFERGLVVVDAAFLPLAGKPFNDASLDALQEELGAAIDEARASAAEGTDWFATVAAKYPAPDARPPSDGHSFQRNQLTMQSAESELSLFLTGYSKSHEAFYLADKGDVVGPWVERCRHHAWGAEQNAGAWAFHVKDYRRTRMLGVFEGRERDLAYEDWCDLNYFNWAQESLKALLPKVKVPARS